MDGLTPETTVTVSDVPVGWVDVPIDKLVKAEWNYKEDDEFTAEKLFNNIKRNGQVVNVIIRELEHGKFEICNGNHRYEPLLKLGYKTVHCYNLGKDVSLAAAQRIAIETNETSFPNDPMKLSYTIKAIVEEFDLSDVELTLPYDSSTTTEFLKLADFDWKSYGQEEDTGHLEHTHKSQGVQIKKPVMHTCPECGHTWEDNVTVAAGGSKQELDALDEVDFEFDE